MKISQYPVADAYNGSEVLLGNQNGGTVTFPLTGVQALALPLTGGTLTGNLHIGTGAASANDGALNVRRQVTANEFTDTIRDDSTFTMTADGNAAASFDTLATMYGSAHYNHFNGYQARQIFAGSNQVDGMNGFSSGMSVNSGTAAYVKGVEIADTQGAGTVTVQYGLFIEQLSKGVTNLAIYSVGTTPSYLGGNLAVGGGFIAQSAVATTVASFNAVHIEDATGAGSITGNQVGVYFDQMSKGAGNFSIYSAGTQGSYHAGNWHVGTGGLTLDGALTFTKPQQLTGTGFLATGTLSAYAAGGGVDIYGTYGSAGAIEAFSDAGVTHKVLSLQPTGASPVVVGTATATMSNAGLEIGGAASALLLPRLTTTQRNALGAVNGMLVYDTTLNKFYGYEAGTWVGAF